MRWKRVIMIAVVASCAVAWGPVPLTTTYEIPREVLVKKQWGRQGHWQECIRKVQVNGEWRSRNCAG